MLDWQDVDHSFVIEPDLSSQKRFKVKELAVRLHFSPSILFFFRMFR